MISHPNCKINIGLQVMRKRPDGYHDLETLFYPVPLCDTLEICAAETFDFTQTGIPVDCPLEENICVKAYRLLQADFADKVHPVRMRLEKNIPFGAGLGGGSSDAAFTLKMLNGLFALGLDADTLRGYAVRLGADCAFFIDNVPAFAMGIGDQLEPMNIDLQDYTILLVKPDDVVSTKEAYGGVKVRNVEHSALREALLQPVATWQNTVVNDFETSVFQHHPHIAELKDWMRTHGATYAAMSGSGSTVFGLFPSIVSMEAIINQLQSQLTFHVSIYQTNQI